jgi:hypothetical protein
MYVRVCVRVAAMVVLNPAAAKTSFQAGRRLAQAGAVLGM